MPSRLAQFERGGEIFFQRQPTAFVCLKDNSLEVYFIATARIGEAAIELANLRQNFLGPIAASILRRKANAIRQQYSVARNRLIGIQIRGDQLRRDDQRVADIHEFFA